MHIALQPASKVTGLDNRIIVFATPKKQMLAD